MTVKAKKNWFGSGLFILALSLFIGVIVLGAKDEVRITEIEKKVDAKVDANVYEPFKIRNDQDHATIKVGQAELIKKIDDQNKLISEQSDLIHEMLGALKQFNIFNGATRTKIKVQK